MTVIEQQKKNTYFWHKNETQGPCGTENDEYGNDDERGILMIPKDKAHSHPEDAHNGHVVDRHPHVFGIVERGYLNLTGFPG